MKTIRITDKTHKWLVMQRALTGIPANQILQSLIEREINNANRTNLQAAAQSPKVAKEKA